MRPSAAGRKASRNTAGEESWAAVSGRTMMKSVSDDCAARCRRRSDDDCAYCDHRISAPQLPARRICSADQRASEVFGVLICNRRSSVSPIYPSPNPSGMCGGWTSAIGRSPSSLRAGRKSLNSPTPGCWTSRSISEPTGQPPPGNSVDSAG